MPKTSKAPFVRFDANHFEKNELPVLEKHILALRNQGKQGYVAVYSASGIIIAMPIDERAMGDQDMTFIEVLNGSVLTKFMAPLPPGKIVHLNQSPFPGDVIETQPLSMADMKERVPAWKARHPEGYFFAPGENAEDGAFCYFGSLHDEPEGKTKAFFSLIFALLSLNVYAEYQVGKTYHLPCQLPFPGTVVGEIGQKLN